MSLRARGLFAVAVAVVTALAACQHGGASPALLPSGGGAAARMSPGAPPGSAAAVPSITYRSLEDAARAGDAAVGQLLVVSARVSGVEAEGLRLQVCDGKNPELYARVGDAARAKVRTALASPSTCTNWQLSLDEAVYAPDANGWRRLPWTLATAVDLPQTTPLADPLEPLSPTELVLRPRPPGTKVRARVRITSVDYDSYRAEVCDADPSLVTLSLEHRTMGDALARAVERASPEDPNRGATDSLHFGGSDRSAPCFDLDAETLASNAGSTFDARPVSMRLDGEPAVVNDLPLADAPLARVVDAHRAPADGVGKRLSTWIVAEHDMLDDGTFGATECGIPRHDVMLVRFAPAQRAAVKTLLARGCLRATLSIEGGRDEAGGVALTARLLSIDPASRVMTTSWDRGGPDADPLLAAAFDGDAARGRVLTVRGRVHEHAGHLNVGSDYAGVRITAVAPTLLAQVERLAADRRVYGQATFRMRLVDRARSMGIDHWNGELLSVSSLRTLPAWLRKVAQYRMRFKLGRLDGEVVDFESCDGGSAMELRTDARFDPLLRGMMADPGGRCATVTFRTTPDDTRVHGEVTAIDDVAPQIPAPAARADLADAFAVDRVDPRGKTAALRVIGTHVGPRGIELRTDGYHDGQRDFSGPLLVLPLGTADERAAGRAFDAATDARAVFRIVDESTLQTSPKTYVASLASAVAPGAPRRLERWRGLRGLELAALQDDATGRELPLDVSVLAVRGSRWIASVEGTVFSIDLSIPPALAGAAARIASYPQHTAVRVRLVGRDGTCEDREPLGCWHAELVAVP